MKKIILCSFIAISILSCKKAESEKKSENKTETKKDSIVEEKITISEITDSLKKSDYSSELSKYSDETLKKVASYMTILRQGVNGEFNQEALKEITSIKDNIITLYWDYGTGASMEHQKLQIKENNVIDLGNGFDKLSEKENLRLEKIVKSKVKNFSHISGRNEAEIEIKDNGNYLISFGGLTDEDAEVSGGSLKITYETKDLITFITNSVKVEKKQITE